MDTLPPYVVYQILKRSTFEDRLLTLQHVCQNWQRWTPFDDLRSLKISDFERLRLNPALWRRQTPSADYFQSNQKWLETLLDHLIPLAGSNVKKIQFDSHWPQVNDTPPFFCAPEGFKRWALTKDLMSLIEQVCGRNLKELSLIEENFVYTELDKEAYQLLTSKKFPRLRRLAIARVDSAFGPYLRQLSLKSLAISGENAPLDVAEPENLKSLHLSHPFPEIYQNHSNFYLSRHFPNLENHSEQLLVEFEQLSETAQRKRLADYRQLPNFKRFRVELGSENGVQTGLSSISGYGLPKLRGAVNLQVRQPGELAANIRFIGQLRHVKIEGLLDHEDALALFCGLPELEHLTLSCRWISDEQREREQLLSIETATEKKEKQIVNLKKLRNFRLSLWETVPKWVLALLKDGFGSAKSLRSFRLQDYNAEESPAFFDDIGLNQISQNLKQLNCRIGNIQTCKEHLKSILQNRWPKLTNFTWHATKMEFDRDLVQNLIENVPNLKRFNVEPPNGPLRPILPGNDGDDGVCQFDKDALIDLLQSLHKLEEVRLFATSTVNERLTGSIAAHRNLKTIKIWDGILESGLDSVLDRFDWKSKSLKRDNEFRRKPLFMEIFILRTVGKANKIQELGHHSKDGNVFFLANARLNAIDEQSFYFP